MGSIIRFTHKKCDFKFDFHEGFGFTLFRLQCDARTHMRNGDWGNYWKTLIEQYPEGTATLNNALCYCKICKKYFSEPHISFHIPKEGFHYNFPNGEDKVPSYIIYDNYVYLDGETHICPNCNRTVVEKIHPTKIPCPICGEMRRRRKIGDWD